jgi:hypothetical protein
VHSKSAPEEKKDVNVLWTGYFIIPYMRNLHDLHGRPMSARANTRRTYLVREIAYTAQPKGGIMGKYDNLRPGGFISGDVPKKGTLTCFAVKADTASKIYGVTARHVLRSSKQCFTPDPTNNMLPVLIGTKISWIQNTDLAYFEILDEVRKELTEQNFRPVGEAVEPLQVWDPGKLRQKHNDAATMEAQTRMENKTMEVFHLGHTQQATGMQKTPGKILKFIADPKYPTMKILSTNLAVGDSGGPVLDGKGRYVGLVSSGGDEKASTMGQVVALKDAFDSCGLVLATWKNRAAWA